MLKTFLLFTLFINFLYANVFINTQNKFYAGDAVVFTLEANGREIIFPKIENVDGFPVIKNGSSSSLTVVNGRRTQKLIQQYKIFPARTVIIPAFEVIIDGKKYLTEAKNIRQVKVQKTKSKYLDYTIEVSSNELYVGEQTLFTLKFKYRRDLQIVNIRYSEPIFDSFWSKKLGDFNKYNEGAFEVQELKYVIFPQKSGNIKIPSLKMDLALVDVRGTNNSFFGPPTRVEKVYSNALNLNVKKLPKNIFLIGDFTISSKIDKDTLSAGDALNYEIQIQGRGNIDDIPELKLDIPNATIYENKATKTYDMPKGTYGGVYKKTFSIVANEDIKIPSVNLSYFNKKNNLVLELKTQEHNIKVKNKILSDANVQLKKKANTLEPEIKKEILYTSDNQKLLYFFFGFIFSLFVVTLIWYFSKIKEKSSHQELSLEKEIKQTKNVSDLLNRLLSYVNLDKDLDKMIFILESNKDLHFKQMKKDILKIIKDKQIQN